MKNPTVTLMSDFGLKDPYVAEMKAVITSICPKAQIIDISHTVEKFNIRTGAFVLASAAPYFPEGTIHVAVVDPGVGTKRRPILVETNREFYVGPDNGLLLLAAQKQLITHAYTITNSSCMLPRVSNTFHGRDVFAPAAAHLASGTRPEKFGPEIKDYLVPKFSAPEHTKNELRGEVLHIDDFGNIITNLRNTDLKKIGIELGSAVHLKLRDRDLNLNFLSAYGEANTGQPLALIGSHDFLEISLNRGNASEEFETRNGDAVTVEVSNKR